MNMQHFATYAPLAAAVVTAVVNNAAASAEASQASSDRKGSIASELRAFVTRTHDDGVNADDAAAILAAVMVGAELKSGTVKGYKVSFRGYRAMLADGETIDGIDTKKAQEYVASDEVKELNAAKARLRKATANKKVWNAARFNELAELAESMNPAEDKVTLIESTAVIEEARAAA